MPRATPMQFSFNAGEWGRELYGRVDMEKYRSACSIMENFIPTVQGPATRRPGMRFVRLTNDNDIPTRGDVASWLYPYTFGGGEAFILELPTSNSRVYAHKNTLAAPTDYALGTAAATGDNKVSMASSGDMVWMAFQGTNDAPRVLVRDRATGETTFTAPVEYKTINGPFDDINNTTTTVYASARDGAAITVISSAAVFVASDVGRKFKIEAKALNAILAWEPAKAVLLNDLRRSDGKTYKALNAGTTGTIKPIHIEGAEYDGSAGVQWEYQDSGWGYGIITVVTNPTQVTVDTTLADEDGGGMPFSAQSVGAGNATDRWALDAWGGYAVQWDGTETRGYPDYVFFFRNRLGFARSFDRKLWLSVSGDFRNFSAVNESNEVAADMAISITLESSKGNDITFVAPVDNLIVGTTGAEFVVRELTTSDPLGPANIKASAVSNYGSARVAPVVVGSAVVFVSRSGRRLREITYDAVSDGYKTRDLSVFHPNIVSSRITQLAWMSDPDNIIWACQESGELLALSYSQTENVFGWARASLSAGWARSIACAPDTGGADRLWAVVGREDLGSGGVYTYTLERMDLISTQSPVGSVPFLDSYVVAGPGFGTISGLDHLVGYSVDCFYDGKFLPNKIVDPTGTITVGVQYKTAYAGLPAPATLAPMDIEAGAMDGVVQSRIGRIARIAWRMLNTLGGKVGPSLDRLEDVQYREFEHSMDESPPSFTGDKEMAWPGSYDRNHTPIFYTEQPFPVTIVGIIPRITKERD